VVVNGLPAAASARLTEIEVAEADFIKFAALARSPRPAASLAAATGGDLERSVRYREVKRPHGLGDELRAALVTESGTWGGITLLREAGRSPFSPADVRLVTSIGHVLADGLRTALVHAALAADASSRGDGGAGLLLLAGDNSVALADTTAQRWCDELGGRGLPGSLPPVVVAVAGRARAVAGDGRGLGDGDREDGPPGPIGATATARARTLSGRWLTVRGSVLGEGADRRTAVVLEPTRSPELAPLLADAYGLTGRERAVTELVARGHPTAEIADRLHLSPYTVQDHLKTTFEKVGVRTRGQLVARLFFDHYAPRLTDGTPPGPTGWFAR
jgi:DNA-binding CsgD family transcriptional regulator